MPALDAPKLVLASASPRRTDLLGLVGLAPAVLPADVDETPYEGELPAAMVERLATAKAAVVAERVAATEVLDVGLLVVGADTTVEVDGESLGKPVDEREARVMLERLSGRAHSVITGLAVVGWLGSEAVKVSTIQATTVEFRELSEADIDWYLDTGEYKGKAGSYGIQGAASIFVERIQGTYAGVVGLPVATLDRLLSDLGWPLRALSVTQ